MRHITSRRGIMESIRMQSISNDLYNNLRELLSEIEPLGDQKDPEFNQTVNDLKKIHNVLVFMRNSYERSIISITGLQGSGKTTFINQLYDLDSGILPENPGRGEVRPVLITEKKEIEHPQAFIRILNNDNKNHDDGDLDGRYTVIKQPITNQELYNQSKGTSPKTLWFELEVPYKYTMDENKSIVLLPGFENEDNHLSQQMLEYILNMSDRAILIIRKDSIANESNADMINKIKDEYKDINPLIVMSFGDVNPESNAEVMKTLTKELDIDEHQLVCKGEDRDSWVNDFLDKIDSFYDGNPELDQRKYKLLTSISKEIRMHVNTIDEQTKAKLEEKELESAVKDIGSDKDKTHRLILLKKEQLLNQLKRQLQADIQPAKNEAFKEHIAYIDNNESRFKAVKSMFKADALKHAIQHQEKIEKIWSEVITKHDIEQKIYASATSSILKLERDNFGTKQDQVSEPNQLLSFSKIDQKKQSNEVEEYSKEIEIEDTIYRNQMEKINKYFDVDNPIPEELGEKEIATLGIMATAMGRQLLASGELMTEIKEKYDNLGNVENDIQAFTNISEIEKETKKKINKFELNAVSNIFLTRSVLKGIPFVLGVDAAVDGELTLLGNASQALNEVGISISAKALLGWIGVGLITLKSLESLHLQTVRLNAKKMDLANKSQEIYSTIADDYIDGVLNVYSDIFDMMAARVVELQHTRTSNDPDYYSLKRIMYISNELKSNAKSFSKEVKHEKLLFEPTL